MLNVRIQGDDVLNVNPDSAVWNKSTIQGDYLLNVNSDDVVWNKSTMQGWQFVER